MSTVLNARRAAQAAAVTLGLITLGLGLATGPLDALTLLQKSSQHRLSWIAATPMRVVMIHDDVILTGNGPPADQSAGYLSATPGHLKPSTERKVSKIFFTCERSGIPVQEEVFDGDMVANARLAMKAWA